MKTTIISYSAPQAGNDKEFHPELLTFCTKAQMNQVQAGDKSSAEKKVVAEYGEIVFLTYSEEEGVVLLGTDKVPVGSIVTGISKSATVRYRGYVELICFD